MKSCQWFYWTNRSQAEYLNPHHQALNDDEVVIDDLGERGPGSWLCRKRCYGEIKKRSAHLQIKKVNLSFDRLKCNNNKTSSRFSPDDLEGVLVLLVVHAHDEHGSISTGSRDDDSLGAALQVSLKRVDIQSNLYPLVCVCVCVCVWSHVFHNDIREH